MPCLYDLAQLYDAKFVLPHEDSALIFWRRHMAQQPSAARNPDIKVRLSVTEVRPTMCDWACSQYPKREHCRRPILHSLHAKLRRGVGISSIPVSDHDPLNLLSPTTTSLSTIHCTSLHLCHCKVARCWMYNTCEYAHRNATTA